MLSACRQVSLASLGALRVRGADAQSFLQGQLSNDVTRLAAEHALWAGYHNAQGRVIALLRLVQLGPDDVLAILPRELVGTVAQRMGRYILRAKVKLADDSAQWTLSGLLTSEPHSLGATLPLARDGVSRAAGSIAVRVAEEPARWLVVASAEHPAVFAGCDPADPLLWRRLAIAAGEPQVYAATAEEFVAQMLNLDVLGAIAFDKGCYTGQEVIARAHYRGRMKRRLQRFLTRERLRLGPGDAGVLADGRSFKVVDAVELADGRCEFLAVAALETASGAAEAGALPLEADSLPLPYGLPE
jgi:tRNA-modifying protein YgfZ